MDVNHFINIHPEKKEILLVPNGITNSERRFYYDMGYYGISLKKNEENIKLRTISESMEYVDFKQSNEYKKIILVKNPYWRLLMSYLWVYVISSGEHKDYEKDFKSFVNRLVLNEKFEKWDDAVRHKIQPINLPHFDEIIYLESIKDPNVKYFEPIKTGGSNYLWSIKNFSDFYDRETAEIVYEKHKNYFEVFNYDFYSYLEFYDPIEKVHSLHGKQSNIFHV